MKRNGRPTSEWLERVAIEQLPEDVDIFFNKNSKAGGNFVITGPGSDGNEKTSIIEARPVFLDEDILQTIHECLVEEYQAVALLDNKGKPVPVKTPPYSGVVEYNRG